MDISPQAIRALEGLKVAVKKIAYQLIPQRALNRLVRSRIPRTAVLEATTACNLECPLCPTHYVPRNSRFLANEHLQDVLESCSGSLKAVCFHMQGEPTVHANLFDLVRHCREAGVSSWFGTNGMLLHRFMDDIFDSGLEVISIDIDGITAEDYQKYRVRGNFDRVVANTQALVKEKRRRGSRLPLIQIQTVMFSYNENKEDQVREFLDSFGADQTLMKRPSYFHDIEYGKSKGLEISQKAQVKADHAAREFLKLVDQDDVDRKFSRDAEAAPETLYRNQRLCPQLERTTVLSDGRVVACCMDGIGMTTFGDLNEESFAEAWQGKRHKQLIQRFMGKTLDLCETCTLAHPSKASR